MRILEAALRLKWYLALGKVVKQQVRTGPEDDIVQNCKTVHIFL